MIFHFGIICFILSVSVDTAPPASYCEILAKVVSEAKKPIMLRIELPHGQQAEQLTYEEPGTKEIILQGHNCGTHHWKLNTYKKDTEGQWQLAKESKAKIDGIGGQMTIKLDDGMQPRVAGRYRVSCGESAICGGGLLPPAGGGGAQSG